MLEKILMFAAAALILAVIYGAARFYYEADMLWAIVIAFVVVVAGLNYVRDKEPSAPVASETLFKSDSSVQTQPARETEAAPAYGGGDLPGSWDNKYNRNGTTSQSFELDDVLYGCKGFSLDYEVVDVSKGKLKSGSQFKAFVRNTDGDWIAVKTFKLKDNQAHLNIKFDKKIDVESIAVVCFQASNFEFSYHFTVYDPIS